MRPALLAHFDGTSEHWAVAVWLIMVMRERNYTGTRYCRLFPALTFSRARDCGGILLHMERLLLEALHVVIRLQREAEIETKIERLGVMCDKSNSLEML
jgi:hypothetical protein